MSRSRRKQVEAEDKSDIDLTPMLDVVFIMLIFFIVTASFVKEKTLPINTPPDNDQQVQSSESSNILITVLSNNDVEIDGRKVDLRSVKSLVATKKAASPEASVIIRAHEQSNAETYVALMDASREAKVGSVALVPFNDSGK